MNHDESVRLDYFAARAMQGMLAHPTRYKPRDCDVHLGSWHLAMVKEAYEIADAMMKVRSSPRTRDIG